MKKNRPNNLYVPFLVMAFVSCAGKGNAQTPAAAEKAPDPPVAKEEPAKAPSPSTEESVPSPPAPQVDVSIDSPTQVIKNYTEELKKIAAPGKEKKKGERDAAREEQIASKVREFFDFEGLARLSLGRHWSKVTPAQRKEFSKLFINLVEDSYIRKSRDIVADYNLTYGKEEVRKNYSKVTVSVAQDDADIDIVYELHRKGKNWMIYNIILDDVDLVRNYQTQFNHIISKDSFEGLLKKMRKKLNEAEKEIIL